MSDFKNRLDNLFDWKDAEETPPEKEPETVPPAEEQPQDPGQPEPSNQPGAPPAGQAPAQPNWPASDRQPSPPAAAPRWPASDREPPASPPAPKPTAQPQAPQLPTYDRQLIAHPPTPPAPPAPPEPLAQAEIPLATPRFVDDEKVQRRKRRAAESILENEALTADLDDRSAKSLNTLGLRFAERAAQNTAGMDDGTAETVMDEGLRAARKMLRAVSQWIVSQQQGDNQASESSLERIFEQAAALYGPQFTLPSPEERRALLQQAAALVRDPAALIEHLRTRLEKLGG